MVYYFSAKKLSMYLNFAQDCSKKFQWSPLLLKAEYHCKTENKISSKISKESRFVKRFMFQKCPSMKTLNFCEMNKLV